MASPLFALLMTCLPVAAALERAIPRRQAGRLGCIVGYSLLLGMVGVSVVMRAFDLLDIPFTLWGVGIVWSATGLLSLLIPRCNAFAASNARTDTLGKMIVAICITLIALRLYTLGLEAILRPTYAWDSKQHWGMLARVFYEFAELQTYVARDQWLNGDGTDYTNLHPSYPITVPLVQTWFAMALGSWDESLVGFPWVLCYVALGCLFYGQARMAGAGPALSTAGTYMLLSLPYLNIQVALPGYADLFLATSLLGAAGAFYNWAHDRRVWQAVLAAGSLLTCLGIKHEGFFWLLCFVPGLLMVLLGWRVSLPLLGGLLVGLVLFLFWLPEDLIIAGHSLQGMQLGMRPEGWTPVYRSALVHDNWHLAIYLLCVAAFGLLIRREGKPALLGLGTALLCAIGLYLMLFVGTDRVSGAIRYTALNRVALQLTPALGLFTLLAFYQLARPLTPALSAEK
ncbi:MAG: hypothetical protein AAGA91_13330 [Pseudomonadota bacterium]